MRRLSPNGRDVPTDTVTNALLDRCRQGDEDAWAKLVEMTHREVYTLCFRILGNAEDAADATQDAYLKAWRGLKAFRGDAAFTTWMYRVASNAAISRLRGRSRRRLHETQASDHLLETIPASASTEASAGARLDLVRLETALGSLDDIYRSALVLRDVYGMTMAEVAERLGITETAAKVRVHRARKKLKSLVYGGKEAV